MNTDILIPLFVVLPLSAGFLIPLAGYISERLAGAIAVITMLLLSLFAVMRIGADDTIYAVGGWTPPFGINLVGDALSGLFLVMISVVGFLIAVYSLVYMRRYTSNVKYYSLFMLMIAGMNGVTVTGDMFNMYVFLEIAAISSYALVAFGIGAEELEASFKYLVLGSLGSSFILIGIALLYSITGTLNLAHIGRELAGMPSAGIVRFITALFIMGFGLKAALMPFHAWLPDAHPSAPAPISAMLSGLLIKILGVYCMIRLIYNVFGFDASLSTILIALGIFSMAGGALLAIGQSDFKRMLAYSSISQMGYIIFAFGLGTPLAIIGGLLHLLNHAVFKSLLFLCSGAVEYATGTRNLNELGGLWKKMPVTSVTCSAASLSISGIPPFGGFFSKFIIIVAAVQAYEIIGPAAYVYAAIAVFVSFLTIVYFVRIQKMVLFGPLPARLATVKEVPLAMGSVLVVLAVLCLVLGIAFPWFVSVFMEPAREVMLDKGSFILKVLGSL